MRNINKDIKKLVTYGEHFKLVEGEDVKYAINRLCDILGLVEYCDVDLEEFVIPNEPSELLTPILDFACRQELISPNTIVRRDLFEAKLMDVLIPRPSEINRVFNEFSTTAEATEYFYDLSQKSNYIKTARTNKNAVWKSNTKYGILDLTINLSKPEKDPRDIIAAGNKTSGSYPKCLLCKENVGYNGATTNIGRTNHRIIPLNINDESFYLQYSPYVYYNEHCIVLQKDHKPMKVTINTFKRLLDFVDQFPHYFLGSNAGLPIVGGSILAHEHYQGGRHKFPIEDAKIIGEFIHDEVTFKQLYWPLSVIRLESQNKDKVIENGLKLFTFWETYSNPEIGIFASTKNTPHNAITPIARKKGDIYYLDMTLRNNYTNDQFPLGLFHPHEENHHIKKENIGLIEVMGLAVLPARLAVEIPAIKESLINNSSLPVELSIHDNWLIELKEIYRGSDIDDFLNDQIGVKFMKCIEDAGVFKQDETGQKFFASFMEELHEELLK